MPLSAGLFLNLLVFRNSDSYVDSQQPEQPQVRNSRKPNR